MRTNFSILLRLKIYYYQYVEPFWVIPCEITHSKNELLLIVFILSTQSVHPMRVHNPEYQSAVTSGSRVRGCVNFVN